MKLPAKTGPSLAVLPAIDNATALDDDVGCAVGCDPAAILRDAEAARLQWKLRPSEYTAALLRVVEQVTEGRHFRRAIEIGVGSGVLLTAIARSSVGRLWGTDVEPDALRATAASLMAMGYSGRSLLLSSDVWDSVGDDGFDLVIANLPHYPADLPAKSDRFRSWSGGGRRLVDKFLRGLPEKLSDDGAAFITHLDLIGLDETMALIGSLGLVARSAFVWSVFENADRIRAVLDGGAPRSAVASLRRHGDYYFVDARVLEIVRRDGAFNTGMA